MKSNIITLVQLVKEVVARVKQGLEIINEMLEEENSKEIDKSEKTSDD